MALEGIEAPAFMLRVGVASALPSLCACLEPLERPTGTPGRRGQGWGRRKAAQGCYEPGAGLLRVVSGPGSAVLDVRDELGAQVALNRQPGVPGVRPVPQVRVIVVNRCPAPES
ncbi:hypothetical protein GCM10010394_55690 [Streptomyces crystallinus]|uniref:Uncharacterized protein n=1 Tax=Streptomyces crystallinus TaxID=68191 RepID=A0ABN1GSF6_9ACTN